jgi:hypothetical protein
VKTNEYRKKLINAGKTNIYKGKPINIGTFVAKM